MRSEHLQTSESDSREDSGGKFEILAFFSRDDILHTQRRELTLFRDDEKTQGERKLSSPVMSFPQITEATVK